MNVTHTHHRDRGEVAGAWQGDMKAQSTAFDTLGLVIEQTWIDLRLSYLKYSTVGGSNEGLNGFLL